MPVGVSRATDIATGWRVLVNLEGRFLLVGRDEIDNIPSLGDAEFDRAGGWGFEVSAEFRNTRAGISIEPFLHVMQPSDSNTENVGGTDASLSQTDNAAGGVRFIWSF